MYVIAINDCIHIVLYKLWRDKEILYLFKNKTTISNINPRREMNKIKSIVKW